MSYHDKDGKIALDAVNLATDTLKPINSRPNGLFSAKLRCELDFTEIKKDNIPAIAVLFDYFIPLDQSTNPTITRGNLGVTFWDLPFCLIISY